MSYAVFFNYENTTYRLPTNPAEMTRERKQAIEKFKILKLGEIVIPTHFELWYYSFECEFPKEPTHYTHTNNDFKNADFYLSLFQKIGDENKPVRFIASNGITEDINSLVLVDTVKEVEKAGEEGDKYLSFELIEYKEHKKEVQVVQKVQIGSTTALTVKETPKEETNPKSNGSYTVKSGDSLWAIAKKYYGNGAKWPKIHAANKDKVKNPNLIYPGQKLVIP